MEREAYQGNSGESLPSVWKVFRFGLRVGEEKIASPGAQHGSKRLICLCLQGAFAFPRSDDVDTGQTPLWFWAEKGPHPSKFARHGCLSA